MQHYLYSISVLSDYDLEYDGMVNIGPKRGPVWRTMPSIVFIYNNEQNNRQGRSSKAESFTVLL